MGASSCSASRAVRGPGCAAVVMQQRKQWQVPLHCCCRSHKQHLQAAGPQEQLQKQQKQPQDSHHLHSSTWHAAMGRRATLAALAGTCFTAAASTLSAAQAAPPLPPGPNTAVLDSLRKLKKQERLFGEEDPRTALSQRFESVQAQLQRCQLLVKINQYDNARMQLREGAFKSLRMDLGYGQEMYRLVPEKVGAWLLCGCAVLTFGKEGGLLASCAHVDLLCRLLRLAPPLRP